MHCRALYSIAEIVEFLSNALRFGVLQCAAKNCKAIAEHSKGCRVSQGYCRALQRMQSIAGLLKSIAELEDFTSLQRIVELLTLAKRFIAKHYRELQRYCRAF